LSASHPQRRLSMPLNAMHRCPFITGNISEQALVKATLVLWSRPLQKSPGILGPGLVIQQDDRMCIFRAWLQVEVVIDLSEGICGVAASAWRY
jgi:hypothetical protein